MDQPIHSISGQFQYGAINPDKVFLGFEVSHNFKNLKKY